MARFRKIDPRLWKDEKFTKLDPLDTYIAIYAITAQSNRSGMFVFSLGMAAEDTKIDAERFRNGLRRVCQTLVWKWDEEARVLLIPTWFKHNQLDNENMVKACIQEIRELPQTKLFQHLKELASHLPETLRERFMEPFGNGLANQEKEKEKEKEQEKPPLAPPRGGEMVCDGDSVETEWSNLLSVYPAKGQIGTESAKRCFAKMPADVRVEVVKAAKTYAAHIRSSCQRTMHISTFVCPKRGESRGKWHDFSIMPSDEIKLAPVVNNRRRA